MEMVIRLSVQVKFKATNYGVERINNALGMPDSTINGVINELVKANIIKETTGYSKNQVFIFKDYINIFLSD